MNKKKTVYEYYSQNAFMMTFWTIEMALKLYPVMKRIEDEFKKYELKSQLDSSREEMPAWKFMAHKRLTDIINHHLVSPYDEDFWSWSVGVTKED